MVSGIVKRVTVQDLFFMSIVDVGKWKVLTPWVSGPSAVVIDLDQALGESANRGCAGGMLSLLLIFQIMFEGFWRRVRRIDLQRLSNS